MTRVVAIDLAREMLISQKYQCQYRLPEATDHLLTEQVHSAYIVGLAIVSRVLLENEFLPLDATLVW